MKKLTPPNYCRNAIPTESGWRHPQSNELLVAVNIKQEQINEYMGITPAPLPLREVMHEEMVDVPLEDNDYDSMSKRELEELGREHGIELDRRQSKKVLIQELKEAIED